MGSFLFLLDLLTGHDPPRTRPFPCPPPATRGEGGRRPGEGRFMDSLPVNFIANGSKGSIGLLDEQPLQPGQDAAAVGAGQMRVRSAGSVRGPALGLEFDVPLQQVQLLAEFPDTAAKRVE